MTFQRNIPQPGDLISVSQDNLLQNFKAINDSYEVNHVLFNLSGTGKHKFVEMPSQTSDPAGAPSEVTLFSRTQNLPSTGIVNIWYKRNAEPDAFQLTGTNPTNAAKGSTFLPGGLLMQWNRETVTGSGATYTFLNPFSAAPYSITITPTRGNDDRRSLYIQSGTVNESEFKIITDSSSWIEIFWMAIGPGPV